MAVGLKESTLTMDKIIMPHYALLRDNLLNDYGLRTGLNHFPVPVPAPAVRQIDATQQQRQFLVAEHHPGLSARHRWPPEAALLQPLGADP